MAGDTALHDAFALEISPKSANRGLVRRLLDNTLAPAEREKLGRVEDVMRLEHEGLKLPAIAAELGLTVDALRSWVRTEEYRIFRKYLTERTQLTDDVTLQDRRKRRRRRWEGFGDRALDYYDFAFKRDKKGGYEDPDRAERAAKLVAQGEGWTEPAPAAVKPRDLKSGIIQAQMAAIAAADRKETVVRVTVGDTTVEVGSRPVDTYVPKGDEL